MRLLIFSALLLLSALGVDTDGTAAAAKEKSGGKNKRADETWSCPFGVQCNDEARRGKGAGHYTGVEMRKAPAASLEAITGVIEDPGEPVCKSCYNKLYSKLSGKRCRKTARQWEARHGEVKDEDEENAPAQKASKTEAAAKRPPPKKRVSDAAAHQVPKPPVFRLMSKEPGRVLFQGEVVECKWRASEGGNQWFPGVVAAIHADGTSDIDFTDGSGDKDKHVHPQHIKVQVAAAREVGKAQKVAHNTPEPGPDAPGGAAHL